MARDYSLLSSTTPTAIAPTDIAIGHVQLRDLIICPKEPSIVNYVKGRTIVEQNLKAPASAARTVAELDFTPNTIASLPVGNDDILIAAGGQEADIHISYYTPSPGRRKLKNVWSINRKLQGTINNSVLLTSMSMTRSNESSVEPRVGVSNNDCTVRLYDIPVRAGGLKKARKCDQLLSEAGSVQMDVPINHSSISPDGRTLLSVGDSSQVYLHSITGGAHITFSHIMTMSLPPPDYSLERISALAASFSTAFSTDGMKFAVGSQEGMVAVWDVRSTKPLKVFHTDKTRGPVLTRGDMDELTWNWGRGRAPAWSVRTVKFGGTPGGKEVLTFTEHTDLVHVIDARTFETDEIIRVPTARPKDGRFPSTRSLPAATPPTRTSRYLRPPSSVPYPLRSLQTTSRLPAPTQFSPSPSPSRTSSPRLIVSPPAQQGTRTSTPAFVQALGDTFRIQSSYSPPASIGDSTWMPLSGFGARRLSNTTATPEAERERERVRQQDHRERDRRPNDDHEEGDDIVVIPHLGDHEVETHIQSLLEMHGMTVRQSSSSLRADAEGHEEEDGNADFMYHVGGGGVGHRQRLSNARQNGMDTDELDSDCLSREPSRAGSPRPTAMNHLHNSRHHWPLTPHESPYGSPTTSPVILGGGTASARAPSRMEVVLDEDEHGDSDEDDDMEDEIEEQDRDDEGNGTSAKDLLQVEYEDDVDLAGVCFDPSGQRMYVASTKSVAEWTIRGGEKRWWAGFEWN